MLKFRTSQNILSFFIDSGMMDDMKEEFLETLLVPDNVIKVGAERIRGLINPLKDFRRSQSSKTSWKRHRYNFMKGINRFHKSTKGKRFHRTMAKHLALKDTSKGMLVTARESFSDLDFLKSVSSALTHGVIELEYYENLYDNREFELFYEDEFSEVLQDIIRNLSKGDDLDETQVDYLFRLVEPEAMITAIFNTCEKTDIEKIKTFVESTERSLIKRLESKDTKGFYLELFNKTKNKFKGK